MERIDTTAPCAAGGWCVLPDGIEHAATGYFIERAVIDARRADGSWEWPRQLAQKSWCAPAAFEAAFRAALARFGIAPDARLAASFATGAVTGGAVGFRPLADLVTMPAARASVRRGPAARAAARSLRGAAQDRRLAEVAL